MDKLVIPRVAMVVENPWNGEVAGKSAFLQPIFGLAGQFNWVGFGPPQKHYLFSWSTTFMQRAPSPIIFAPYPGSGDVSHPTSESSSGFDMDLACSRDTRIKGTYFAVRGARSIVYTDLYVSFILPVLLYIDFSPPHLGLKLQLQFNLILQLVSNPQSL
jgi:hypothetical protein